jgi:hypothetical protein
VSVALDGGLDWWAASNPEEKDWGAGLFAASATFSPLDWMNPTFPYPGGIFRTSAQVTWRLGDARGYFDFLFGASAFYRSMAVGSLPNTLFADENVVANPEHPAEERRKAFSAGLSPHLGLVVRPSQRLQLSARWMPFLAGSEWSPTRSYDGMFYQNVSGAAEVLLFRDVLGEQRVLLAGEVGVIATWAPVGDGDNPQYDILTGRLIASYERPGLVAHAGIQNLFDPTSFFGDYMNLWALGLGGRGTFELGPPDMMGHRVGFGVDALYAPPLWTRNQQEQVERVGFARIGDDSSTDASRMTFAELSARGEVWLWRGLLLGLSYKYRYSWADLGIEGPDGQTFTMAVEPAGTHVVLYYLGWEGGE